MQKVGNLQLSKEEKQLYQQFFKKINQNMVVILQNKTKCIEFLIKRGSINKENAENIYEAALKTSSSKKENILDEQSFYCLLKFLSALQNDYQFDQIMDIEDLPPLSGPTLTPSSKSNSSSQVKSSEKSKKKKKSSSQKPTNEDEQIYKNINEQFESDQKDKEGEQAQQQQQEQSKSKQSKQSKNNNNGSSRLNDKNMIDENNELIKKNLELLKNGESDQQQYDSNGNSRPRFATFGGTQDNQSVQKNKGTSKEDKLDIIKQISKESGNDDEEEEQKNDSIKDNSDLKQSSQCKAHHTRVATFGNSEEKSEFQEDKINNTKEENKKKNQKKKKSKQLEEQEFIDSENCTESDKETRESNNNNNNNTTFEANNNKFQNINFNQSLFNPQLQQVKESDSNGKQQQQQQQESIGSNNIQSSDDFSEQIQQLQGGLRAINIHYQKNEFHSKYISIQIASHEEKKDSIWAKTYIAYTIQTKIANQNRLYSVQKRYNDFVLLNEYFISCKQYQGVILPQIPPKSYLNQISSILVGNDDENFIEQRKIDLQIYLQSITEHEQLQNDRIFEGFLTDNEFQIPQKQHENLLVNVGSVFQNLSVNNLHDLKDKYNAYVKVKWNQYTHIDNEQKNLELKQINELMGKVDNYEQILISCQTFVTTQIKIEEQKINAINKLSELVPKESDFKQITNLKISLFSYLDKLKLQNNNYSNSCNSNNSGSQINMKKDQVISIKKQLSCVYGIRQQYIKLNQIMDEVSYYCELNHQKIQNGTKEEQQKSQVEMTKHNKHKNQVKKIFLEEFQEFIGQINDNIDITLQNLQKTEIQHWNILYK